MISLPDNRQLIQSPQDDAKGIYFTWLKTAVKSVLICDYSFNLADFQPVIQAFLTAGITVHLALDKTQAAGKTEIPLITELKTLATQYPNLLFIAIGTSSVAHAIMHDKLTVKDETEAQYGSWNYTNSASLENNFFFIDPEPVVAQAFQKIGMDIYNWITENEPQSIEELQGIEELQMSHS